MRDIHQRTISAGPDGVRHPGKHTVSKKEAADMVGAGCAEYCGVSKAENADARPKFQKTQPPVEKPEKKK